MKKNAVKLDINFTQMKENYCSWKKCIFFYNSIFYYKAKQNILWHQKKGRHSKKGEDLLHLVIYFIVYYIYCK